MTEEEALWHKLKIPEPASAEPPRRRAGRRGAWPELELIESLIGQARRLRLELATLEGCEPIAESAHCGVEALTQVGLALEKIAELLVSAKSRKRSHHRKITPPAQPGLEEEAI